MNTFYESIRNIIEQSTRIERASDDKELLLTDLEIIKTEALKLSDMYKGLKDTIVDYMIAEGCSCCRNSEDHKIAADEIGRLLNFEKYSDDSGHDFFKHKSINK